MDDNHIDDDKDGNHYLLLNNTFMQEESLSTCSQARDKYIYSVTTFPPL